MFDSREHPHKRLNILTGEWVLVSPHRMKRPWQGKQESFPAAELPSYDPGCYLCPGNKRSDGTSNPAYKGPYVFTNDFPALLPGIPAGQQNVDDLLVSKSEAGTCRVICFSEDHSLTLPLMDITAIEKLLSVWIQEFKELSATATVRYIQIFENKGEIMGCSNPHPHGQIWASDSLPVEIIKETAQQELYFRQHGKTLLTAYLELELKQGERVIVENEDFAALVPYWAVWPYETMIISKRHIRHITEFTKEECRSFASVLQELTIRYDNLFGVSFPYSAGMHQAPVNSGEQEAWHWHMHFYPPLLRSATVKKFMVGYEMLANPQRDITAEMAAAKLKEQETVHYSRKKVKGS